MVRSAAAIDDGAAMLNANSQSGKDPIANLNPVDRGNLMVPAQRARKRQPYIAHYPPSTI
ncbi:hypothetical protein [Arthrobacter polaris]|uniref:hypothetical protein n=1 Tax=Arthrobacter polaris TaxID=2813727 RepID=UPI003D7C950E